MPGNFQATPGPLLLYVRTAKAGSFSFLGSCQTAPETEMEKFKIPVKNDLGGRSVPFQIIQDGELHTVSGVLNRFDLPVWGSLRRLESGGAVLGSESRYARGQAVIGVSDFQLFILNTYAGTPAAGSPDLARGRFYFSASVAKAKETTVGTRVLDIAFMIECQNVFDPKTHAFRLYTEEASEIGGLPLGALN